MQVYVTASFIWLFYQYLCKRSTFYLSRAPQAVAMLADSLLRVSRKRLFATSLIQNAEGGGGGGGTAHTALFSGLSKVNL